MGCSTSKTAVDEPAGDAAAQLPKYVTADPDLGWKNISGGNGTYPCVGFNLTFQNERSGALVKNIDLVTLALNVAKRAAALADKYGVTDARDLQSHLNILDVLKDSTADHDLANTTTDIDRDMNRVMKQFGCPRFGWKLVSRVEETSALIRGKPQIFLQNASEEMSAINELAAIPDYLQYMTDQEGKLCILDVPEIGMNIAEQLLRLEKSEHSEGSGGNLTELFGWEVLSGVNSRHEANDSRINYAVPVVTPDHTESLMMVPEELLMNVASWIQATYLTAPTF